MCELQSNLSLAVRNHYMPDFMYTHITTIHTN